MPTLRRPPRNHIDRLLASLRNPLDRNFIVPEELDLTSKELGNDKSICYLQFYSLPDVDLPDGVVPAHYRLYLTVENTRQSPAYRLIDEKSWSGLLAVYVSWSSELCPSWLRAGSGPMAFVMTRNALSRFMNQHELWLSINPIPQTYLTATGRSFAELKQFVAISSYAIKHGRLPALPAAAPESFDEREYRPSSSVSESLSALSRRGSARIAAQGRPALLPIEV